MKASRTYHELRLHFGIQMLPLSFCLDSLSNHKSLQSYFQSYHTSQPSLTNTLQWNPLWAVVQSGLMIVQYSAPLQ